MNLRVTPKIYYTILNLLIADPNAIGLNKSVHIVNTIDINRPKMALNPNSKYLKNKIKWNVAPKKARCLKNSRKILQFSHISVRSDPNKSVGTQIKLSQ